MRSWQYLIGILILITLGLIVILIFPKLISGSDAISYEEPQYLIGMSQANLIEPWRVQMNMEFENAVAAHDDLRVIYTDAAQDTDRQKDDVQTLMEYGIDLLVISPNDSEALEPLISEVYSKIPVIVLDRDVSGDDFTLFIGPDNNEIGYLTGLEVLELLGNEGGHVLEITGIQDSPPVSARTSGLSHAIEGHDDIVIEDHIAANWLQDQAQDRFKEYLVAYGKNADVVVAQNDAMAYGAWIAANELRMEGIHFIGVDGLSKEGGGLELVKLGVLDATVVCPTGAQEAVDYIVRILNGEVIPDNEKRLILKPELISSNEISFNTANDEGKEQ